MEAYLNSAEVAELLRPTLYILNKVNHPVNQYNLLKILYFADQKSLAKYNRPVTKDLYHKLQYGPVPSHTYNILKTVNEKNNPAEKYVKRIKKNHFIALQQVDLDEFSVSEIECLDQAIEENIHLSFNQLKDKSHDWAYENTQGSIISKYDIAKAGGATQEQIEYMKEIDVFQDSEWF